MDRIRKSIIGLATIAALAMAGCGGGGSSSASKTTITSAAPSTTTTADPTAAVTQAVETVLGSANAKNTQLIESLIEDGTTPDVQSIVTAGANAARVYSIKVKSVQVLDQGGCSAVPEVYPCATVAFDLYTSAAPGGTPALAGAQAHAVNIGGMWKLSRKSFCSLISLGPEPHCKT